MTPLLKRLAVVIAGLALTLPAAAGAQPGTASGAPVEINVVLSLTGPGAFLGKAYQTTLQAMELHVKQTGGIRGRPLKYVVADSGSNPQTSLQLMNALIAKRVPILIDGGPSFVCNATIPIVSKTGPFDWCLSPVIRPEAGSYVFTASVGTDDFVTILVRYFRLRGWTRLSVLTGTDATGVDLDRQLERVLPMPENAGVQIVAHEHFNPADLSVAAQLARIKAANPQVLLTWSTGTPFGTLLHGIRDAGLNVPVGAATSNQNFQQMAAYADFLPAELYFPSVRAVTKEGTGKGPIREQQLKYFQAFKDIGVRPDYVTNLPWDPLLIVVEALRALGPNASSEQIRDWVAKLHSFAGINGIYDFRDGSQRGIGINAANIQKWDPKLGDFVAVSRPAGYLR